EVDPAEAARLSKSKLMPEHIAGDAASAEYMMRFGAALGIDPMSSFQHIFVFPDGKGRLKAGMSAHLMQALAVAAGHTVHIEGNAVKATAVLVRKTSDEDLQRFQRMREEERRQKLARLEDMDRLYRMQRGQILERIEDIRALAEFDENASPEEIAALRKQIAALHGQYNFDELRESISTTNFDLSKLVRFESVWSMARANQIGLNSKSTWQNYGPEMLKSRAKSGVVRDGAIDVILGVKNILGEMGLSLSEDDHDHLAMASAAYTPEELGAEVNEEGVPIQGEVIDVTKGGSKKQKVMLDAARKAVDKGTPQQLADWATRMTGDDSASVDDKISRIYAIQEAAREAGKGDEVVVQGDASAPLSLHLESIVNSLRN
ncbi:MAG: hypothetical protein ACRDQ0_17775, partial [Pseudonocardia sp.]